MADQQQFEAAASLPKLGDPVQRAVADLLIPLTFSTRLDHKNEVLSTHKESFEETTAPAELLDAAPTVVCSSSSGASSSSVIVFGSSSGRTSSSSSSELLHCIGLFINYSIIFISDSNGEDSEGYVGADLAFFTKHKQFHIPGGCDNQLELGQIG
ncbi:hypothetical protein KSP40_PGU011404 [Platanthera guangdongensis]|uniref:Uncharacterized protein n=1 Tax=Platanthera guangdongensis TaxID=2320717 RepID=A0ABR2LZ27_9ASPA